MLVDASEEGGVLEKQESDMLHAVFDFGDLTAHQVMVPRTEMVTLDVETPMEEVYDFAAQHHRNKYPVYENDFDHIVGILHVKDLVPAVRLPPDQPPTLRQFMREPLFVPDTIGVNDLLARFRQRKQHIAILLDEYAGTAGLVTLQDIMEELVGDVGDVFEPDEPEVQKLPDGSLRLDGLMLLTDFNDVFAVDLVDPNYETIAGYMMGQLDRIPKAGDEVDVPLNDHDRLRLRVEVMDGKRIAWIVLTRVASSNRPVVRTLMTRYAEVAVFPASRAADQARSRKPIPTLSPTTGRTLQPGAFVLAPFGAQSDLDRLVSGVVMRVTD